MRCFSVGQHCHSSTTALTILPPCHRLPVEDGTYEELCRPVLMFTAWTASDVDDVRSTLLNFRLPSYLFAPPWWHPSLSSMVSARDIRLLPSVSNRRRYSTFVAGAVQCHLVTRQPTPWLSSTHTSGGLAKACRSSPLAGTFYRRGWCSFYVTSASATYHRGGLAEESFVSLNSATFHRAGLVKVLRHSRWQTRLRKEESTPNFRGRLNSRTKVWCTWLEGLNPLRQNALPAQGDGWRSQLQGRRPADGQLRRSRTYVECGTCEELSRPVTTSIASDVDDALVTSVAE